MKDPRSAVVDALAAVNAAAQKSKKKVAAGHVRAAGANAISQLVAVVPTGIAVLDRHVLGVGGLPAGRIAEVFGAFSKGKSALILRTAAETQKRGGVAILGESERTLDLDWAARVHGLDVEALVLVEPDTLEEMGTGLITAIEALPPDSGPHFVGWDSLAASVPAVELEGQIGAKHVGARALILNQIFRVMGQKAATRRAAVLVANQIREKVGVSFGSPITTPGGNALNHHASVRLQIYSSEEGLITERGATAGFHIRLKAIKNKVAKPFEEATLRYRFDSGWDDDWSTLQFAKDSCAVKETARDPKKARTSLGWDVDLPLVTPRVAAVVP